MLKVKKLSEKAKTPNMLGENHALELFSTKITTEVGEDAKLVIVYHTDLAVQFPDGYCGVIIPKDDIYKKSIMQTNSITVLTPIVVNNSDGTSYSTFSDEITVRFKTNTDVVPSVYKEGDAFAQMIIVPIYQIDQLDVEEFTSAVEEQVEAT